jgi:SPP1 gp7 family putative phage head morphogenesis protein
LRPIRPSKRNELWYRGQLRALVGHLRTAGAEILAVIKPQWPQVLDMAPPGLDFLLTSAKLKFGKIGDFAKSRAATAVRKNLDDVDERLAGAVKSSLNIDIRAQLTGEGPVAMEMARAARANIELITSIPEQYFDRLREDITEAWATGQPWASIVDRVQEIGDITDNRAALIARDQTSKLNAAFNGVRQKELGIEKYVWETAQDERVRDSHAELDGQTFRWDSPPNVDGESVNPGEAINCRCVAAPSFDIEDAPAESPIASELEAEAA